MKWFKRSFLSITRRKGKTLLLFLVVFSMLSLLAAALCNIATAGNVKEEIKRGLGATASITVNYNDLDEQHFDVDFNQFIEGVQQLSQSEFVDYGEYCLTQNATIHSSELNLDLAMKMLGTDLAENEQFRSGEYQLSSQDKNRTFTEEELSQGKNVILLNMNLGNYAYPGGDAFPTGLAALGKTTSLTITLPYQTQTAEGKTKFDQFSYSFDVEIVGTFVDKKSTTPTVLIPNKVLINSVQLAVSAAKEKGIEISGVDRYPMIQYAGFKLKDSEKLEMFDQQVESLMAKLPTSFYYESSGKNYKKSAGPVENLDTIAQAIFISSILATILILGMVIVYLLLDRQKEVGIYMSLGEKRRCLIAQFMFEILLVSTLAIGCASIGGIFLGNQLSSYMMNVQTATQRDQQLGNKAQYTPYRPASLDEYKREDVLKQYENQLSADYFITLFIVGEITVMISSILPMVLLTRMKPKDIMIGGN